MNRRKIIIGALSTFLLPMLAKAEAKAVAYIVKPILYSDGVTDDWPALQAWALGEPVYYPNGRRVDQHHLQRLYCLVSRTIYFPKDTPVRTLAYSIFNCAEGFTGRCFHFA